MENRRTKNYTEKTSGSNILARLVMPLSVLMALILFYFSVKLFFFSPQQGEFRPQHYTAETAADFEPYEEEDDEEDLSIDDMEDISTDASGSDEAETNSVQPAPTTQRVSATPTTPKQTTATTSRQTTATTSRQTTATKTRTAAQTAPQQSAQSAVARWDVQIGGFRARSGAETTVQQAREKGYSAYIVDDMVGGRPFYKVRVRGYADKNNAAQLSKSLEAAGFPVYVVSVR